MKATGWLTVLQAFSIVAVPLQQGQENFARVAVAPGPIQAQNFIPVCFQTVQVTITKTILITPLFAETQKVASKTKTIASTNNARSSQSSQNKRSVVAQGTTSIAVGAERTNQARTTSVTASVSVKTTSISSGTAQVLPSLTTDVPHTTGSVRTSLDLTGRPTSAPLLSTNIPSPTSLLVASKTSITSVAIKSSSIPPPVKIMTVQNIFQPLGTNAPPSIIKTRSDHPVPKLGIRQNGPISTNKFYSNFFLGSQTGGTWTQPYSVAWSKGGGSTKSWGMSIQHIEASQRVFGPDPNANPAQYFINPIGIQSLVLSALELGASTTLAIDSITAFSANINFLPNAGQAPAITFPLVQGMGFVTGIFNGGTPILQSGVFFRSINKITKSPKTGVTKYSIQLEDGRIWLLYAFSSTGAGFDLTVVTNGLAQATSGFAGTIQIAKSVSTDSEALYDAACGTYPVTTSISATADGAAGSYTLAFSIAGNASTAPLMFALPHHIQSFDPRTQAGVTNFQLDTTTKGKATAVLGNSWTMLEDLPVSMGFAPWGSTPNNQANQGNTQLKLSASAMSALQAVSLSEVSQDMGAQSNLNSMYFSGKALAKFAHILVVQNDLLGQAGLAQAGLVKLKAAFAVFAENRQQFPLVYEQAWGGVVSTGSYVTGDPGVDFGNTYYNDHHFHYGYFILAAAIIGKLDPSWLPSNAPYVNTLVRDIANPSSKDPYFPVSRGMDWFNGHSWAKGLYESYDGKDQESTSEDAMSAYAIKMWGQTTSNPNLEALGNLQLAVDARAIRNYFLYTSDNKIQPSNFIGNKVAGILFENKIDHTTYFGGNIEYVQGIHMLPLLPFSSLTRSKQFVTEEWNLFFSNGRADQVAGGWRGVLYANLALINPSAAWQYFSAPNFDAGTLDGGASRTWYMAMAAGLGGAQ